MTVKRQILAETGQQIESQHTVPFYIAKIEFGTATGYYSESWEVTYDGNTYIEGGIKIGSFRWLPDGVQAGQVSLLNEANAASALILNNTIQNTPIRLYKVYRKADGSYTTPTPYGKGVLTASSVSPKEAVCQVMTSAQDVVQAPNDFFTQVDGYNHLPADGTVVTWNDEKYVIEAKL